MVLKTLTHDRPGGSDCWNYYDNVESASVYYDENAKETCVSVRFKDAESDVVLVVTEVAYLCNDCGGTIDRICPAVKRQDHGEREIKV